MALPSSSRLPLAGAKALEEGNFAARLGEKTSGSGDAIPGFLRSASRHARPPAAPATPPAPAKPELPEALRDLFASPKTLFKNLKVRVDEEGVALVAFSRTPINAFSNELVAEFDRLIDILGSDPAVKSVLLTGEGATFIAGGDLNMLSSMSSTEEGRRMSALWQGMFNRLEALDKPVVAAINAVAIGGGIEVAMASHVRYASSQAKFRLPEIELGILPGAGGPQRLPRLVGLSEAVRLIVSGDFWDAQKSLEIGLVDRVIEPGQVLPEAYREAQRLARLPHEERRDFVAARRTLAREPRLSIRERLGMLFNAWWFKRRAASELRAAGKEELLDIAYGNVEAVVAGVRYGHVEGHKEEARIFGRLASHPKAKILTQLALRRVSGPRLPTAPAKPLPIEQVAVLGPEGAAIAETLSRNGVKALTYPDASGLASAAPAFVLVALSGAPEEQAALLARLGRELPPSTLLALHGTTAGLDALARASGRPERVFALRFSVAPQRLPLVELGLPDASGFTEGQKKAQDQSAATALALIKKSSRIGVLAKGKDSPMVRLMAALLQEGWRLAADGASLGQVGLVMRRMGFPFGPLELAEHTGIVLKAAGSGLGVSDAEVEERLDLALANEAGRLLGEGALESPLDADLLMSAGLGVPLETGGLLRQYDRRGLGDLVSRLSARGFEPAPYLASAASGKGLYDPKHRGVEPQPPSILARLARQGRFLRRWLASWLPSRSPRGPRSAAEREAASLTKGKKPEAMAPHLYRGSLPLTYLSYLDTDLPREEREWMEAYATIVHLGLRPIDQDARAERQALAALEHPSPAVSRVLNELGLDPARLREPLLDVHRIDRDNDIPAALLARMRDLGLLRLKIPRAYGGLGLDQRSYSRVLEVLAEASLAIGTVVSAHSTIGSEPLLMFGTEEQKQRYLRMFASGEGLAAFGLTEPRAGTDLGRLAATAELSPDGKHWKLTGEKIFITGIMDAGLVYVVSGHTKVNGLDLGPSVFVVELPFRLEEGWEAKKAKLLELDRRGLRITPFTRDGLQLMTIRGTDQGFLQFDGFEVPAENVLGPRAKDAWGLPSLPEGRGKMVPLLSLNKGRAGFAPYVAAIAERTAGRAEEWAVDRRMFDMYSKDGGEGRQEHMEYVSTKLGRARIQAAVLKVLARYTSALIDDDHDSSVAALSAAAKARVTDRAWGIAVDAVELGGGHALIKDAPNRMELLFRDLWVTRIGEGVNPALAQLFHILAGGDAERELRTIEGKAAFLWRWFAHAVVPWAVLDRGALPRAEAKEIQRLAARFALKFGWLAARLGKRELAARQNTLIRAFDVAVDIFSLALVQLEIEKGEAPAGELLALHAAVPVLRASIATGLDRLDAAGDPVEDLERGIGEAYVRAERGRKAGREDRLERHLAFLRAEAEGFYRRLGR